MTLAIEYTCYIKQCAIPNCDNWFVGSPKSRYCQPHKKTQYDNMMAHRNGNSHRASRFSEEEIQELRYMFLTNTATEVAEHFNCNRSLVYKYVRQSPQRYRKV